jgi:two-component system response regulator FixJ
MTSKPLVHVVDDDEAMRDSLAFMLEMNGFTPVLHESADAFLSARPDDAEGCVLTDVRMPGMSGLDLARHLTSQGVGLPIIVMTGHGDIPLAVEAMKAGVVDFIEKPFSDDVLVGALRSAINRPPPGNDRGRQEALDRLANLTPREREVLAGVVAGKANKVIAFDLDISARTVEIYRANMMTKTGARNMAELMRIALAAGL